MFVDLAGKRGVQTVAPGFETVKTFSAYHYDQAHQQVLFATSDGTFAIVKIEYKATFGECSAYRRGTTQSRTIFAFRTARLSHQAHRLWRCW